MKIKMLFTVIIFTLISAVYAQDCITGFACSINGDKEQVEANNDKINEENNQNTEKPKTEKKKRKSIFVDGGEYNKPEYTEIFMKNMIFP